MVWPSVPFDRDNDCSARYHLVQQWFAEKRPSVKLDRDNDWYSCTFDFAVAWIKPSPGSLYNGANTLMASSTERQRPPLQRLW